MLQPAKESWIADALPADDDGFGPTSRADRPQGEDRVARPRPKAWHGRADFFTTPLKQQVEARPYTAVILAAVAGGVIAALLRAQGRRLGGIRPFGIGYRRRRR